MKARRMVYILAALILLLAGYLIDEFYLIRSLFGEPAALEGNAFVHYIDVGQGDATLIQTPGGNMLIDTGEYEYATRLSDYLRNNGVRYIDILVATHPHSDHIGGMGEIIKNFDVGTVIMPRATHTSLSYEKMLLAMKERRLKAHAPTVGEEFSLGDAQFMVVAPNSEEYENLNNYSVVLRMLYGSHSFLFTGDAEGLSEREMLSNGLELRADFLKVGHHGSRTGTTENFLKSVAPEFAFISLEAGNSYGHPHEEILDRLEAYGVRVYRTDRHGDIVLETDGERYRIKEE